MTSFTPYFIFAAQFYTVVIMAYTRFCVFPCCSLVFTIIILFNSTLSDLNSAVTLDITPKDKSHRWFQASRGSELSRRDSWTIIDNR